MKLYSIYLIEKSALTSSDPWNLPITRKLVEIFNPDYICLGIYKDRATWCMEDVKMTDVDAIALALKYPEIRIVLNV